MQLPTPTAPHLCNVALLENGILEITWFEATRQATDVHIQLLEDLYHTVDVADSLPILIRSTGAMPPTNYLLQKSLDLQRRYPKRPVTYNAVLYQDNMIIALLDTLLATITHNQRDKVRFFKFDQENKAIEWLLSLG